MICKIVQNGGFIFMILCTLINVIDSSRFERIQTIQEFCSSNRFLSRFEPGEKHQLKLFSHSPISTNKWYQKSKRKCHKEFKTDDAASHIILIVSNMTIPSCSEKCQCNYFEVSVPGHSKKYCGENKSDLYFTTKSDYLSIIFQHDKLMVFNVTLTFIIERNAYIITGDNDESNLRFGQFIETPYFPLAHPSNYKAEYILQPNDMTSHVMLLFLDFVISKDSFIEVVGHNGTHPARFYGNLIRPPFLISQSQRLELKFEANNQPGKPGFRALCSFVKSTSQIQNVITDCGGAKSERGGIIVKQPHKSGLYDCIWHVIHTPPFFLQYSKQFYTSVSILGLNDVGPKAFLEFREGLFSKSKLVKFIDCETTNCSQVVEEITVSASSGLYIRFSGYLRVESIISLAYSTYHTGNCSEIEKSCLNERCLQPDLLCDGVKHCPDGSDEELCLSTEEVTSEKVLIYPPIKVRLHKSNVEAAFIVILVFGIFGIIAFIVVFSISYRIFKSVPRIIEQIPPPEVINEVTGSQLGLYTRPSSDYDPPPSYDDFIKSADEYPPLLFTRAKRRSEPYNSYHHAQQTTSFYTSERKRHHSEHVFLDPGNSNCSNDMFCYKSDANTSLPSEPSCSFHQSNMEWTVENAILKPHRNGIKRSNSLDSKLDEVLTHSTCRFYFSIVHPKCHVSNQRAQFQCYTMPTNFKMKDFQSYENSASCKISSESVECLETKHSDVSKSRHLSWSFIPHVSSSNSEVLTMVKTRCHSDPCKVIVQYSLYP